MKIYVYIYICMNIPYMIKIQSQVLGQCWFKRKNTRFPSFPSQSESLWCDLEKFWGGLQFVVGYLCQCLGCCDPFRLLKTQVGQMFRVHWWVGDSASLHRDSHETHRSCQSNSRGYKSCMSDSWREGVYPRGWDAALEGLHAVQAAGKMGIEVDTVSSVAVVRFFFWGCWLLIARCMNIL